MAKPSVPEVSAISTEQSAHTEMVFIYFLLQQVKQINFP